MKFFFHVRDIDGYEEDLEGIELSDLSEAVEEAKKAAREMVAEIVMQEEKVDGRAFDIADRDGVVLMTVPFKDVIDLD